MVPKEQVINVLPRTGSWKFVLKSVVEGSISFKRALDDIAYDQFGSDQKVTFLFDKSFPHVDKVMKYNGQRGMNIMLDETTKQLHVYIDFTQ